MLRNSWDFKSEHWKHFHCILYWFLTGQISGLNICLCIFWIDFYCHLNWQMSIIFKWAMQHSGCDSIVPLTAKRQDILTAWLIANSCWQQPCWDKKKNNLQSGHLANVSYLWELWHFWRNSAVVFASSRSVYVGFHEVLKFPSFWRHANEVD